MLVADLGAVVAEVAEFVGERGVVGRHCARIGERAEVFARVEAHARGMAEGAGGATVATRTVGLGGIFQDEQSVTVGDRVDGAHICGLAVEVDGEDDLGPRREERFDSGGI